MGKFNEESFAKVQSFIGYISDGRRVVRQEKCKIPMPLTLVNFRPL
jgi:hypothetical protein